MYEFEMEGKGNESAIYFIQKLAGFLISGRNFTRFGLFNSFDRFSGGEKPGSKSAA